MQIRLNILQTNLINDYIIFELGEDFFKLFKDYDNNFLKNWPIIKQRFIKLIRDSNISNSSDLILINSLNSVDSDKKIIF